MSEEKKPFVLGNDFTLPELALTKEQHDRITAATGRPYTQDPIGTLRARSSHRSFSRPTTDESIAQRAREEDEK